MVHGAHAQVQSEPTHPGLVALCARNRCLFWRGADGLEALVLGKKLYAARPKGPVREALAALLEGDGRRAPRLGDVVRGLVGPARPTRTVRHVPTKAFEVVYVAYDKQGRARAWNRVRALAGKDAMKRGGFVRRYHVPPFDDAQGPSGIWGTERERIAAMPAPPEHHPRGGTTDLQSVLLPKERFPQKRDAASWLRAQKPPLRADRIEDSGKVRPGNFWRARQFDPRPGFRKVTKRFGESGIRGVFEAHGRRRAA